MGDFIDDLPYNAPTFVTAPKPADDELPTLVRELLLYSWDPIGIKNCPEAHNEYDSYVGGVCHLLRSGADKHKLQRHLVDIETESMGLSVPCPRRNEVVRSLLALVDRN